MSIAGHAVGRLAKATRSCLGALLARDCLLCAAPSADSLLCPACSDSLPRLPKERCPICASPTPVSEICGACLKQAPHFDATTAVFCYEFPLDRLIQALKYGHRLACADFELYDETFDPANHDSVLYICIPVEKA